MTNPIPAESDSSRWYECVNCSYRIDVESVHAKPRCLNCSGPCVWEFRSGGQSTAESPDDQLRI